MKRKSSTPFRLFVRTRNRNESFYTRLNEAIAGTTSIRTLLKRVARLFVDTFGATHVSFVVFHGASQVSAGSEGYERVSKQDSTWLYEYITRQDEDTRAEQIAVPRDGSDESLHLRRLMITYRIELIVPLVRAGEVIGCIYMGEKASGSYSPSDVYNIHAVTDELVVAIQNALSIQEVRDLNETLQHRIDEATRELRQSNARLMRLDEAKDEFISMASHQLRTPLTSIKGYIDMILEGDAGKITAQQRAFLTEAFASSERMVHLINDFLSVSRLQTGKFIIEKRPVDLAKIVAQELDSLAISAGQRNLAFSYHAPKQFPLLTLDEAKIRQVIMNFADNALYYSTEGTTIAVKLRIVDKTYVELTVKDTGIGVPESERAELFTKFFRASNARKQRPDGTGVGLYLAKRVIAAHGGSMIFSSVEGRGSTFGFRLPIEALRPETPPEN